MKAQKPAQYAPPPESHFYYLRLDELGREHRNDATGFVNREYARSIGYNLVEVFPARGIERCKWWSKEKEPPQPPPGAGWTIIECDWSKDHLTYQRPVRKKTEQINELYFLQGPMPEGSLREVIRESDGTFLEMEYSKGYLERPEWMGPRPQAYKPWRQ